MGGFINSQADAEICEVLNKRFSDDVNASGQTYLDELRKFFQVRENLFNNGHKLNRVFHRLAIGVTGGASVPKTKKSRLRWFHLLKNNLPAAVEKAIRGQLTSILSAGNPASAVKYVTFSTVHQPTSTGDQFELLPANSVTPDVFTDANGKAYCAIVLRCNDDMGLPDAPNETDPPAVDSGVEQGAIPFTRARTRRPPKKYQAKKSGRKSAKKVSKKKASKKRPRR